MKPIACRRRDLRRPWTTAPRPRATMPKPAPGSTRHERRFGHFIGGALAQPASRHAASTPSNPATGERAGPGRRRAARPTSTPPSPRRAQAQPAWAALPRPRARARHLYALARLIQKHSRLLRRARDARQRQADPRDARHRHAAGRPPLLPPRRLGAAAWSSEFPDQRAGRRRAARSSRGTSRC